MNEVVEPPSVIVSLVEEKLANEIPSGSVISKFNESPVPIVKPDEVETMDTKKSNLSKPRLNSN